jgi:hypothetical protein
VLIVACLPTIPPEPARPFKPVEPPPPIRNPHDAAVAAPRQAAPGPVATAPRKPPVVAADAVPARPARDVEPDDAAATAMLAEWDRKAKPPHTQASPDATAAAMRRTAFRKGDRVQLTEPARALGMRAAVRLSGLGVVVARPWGRRRDRRLRQLSGGQSSPSSSHSAALPPAASWRSSWLGSV